MVRSVTTKLVRPKIGLGRQILEENVAKLVPRTIFAAKIGPAEPILAAKTGSTLPIVVPYKL